jgi:mannan endo-1,4-beta-mannosidase
MCPVLLWRCVYRRKYSEDPTIIAWNLINEPRCESWLPANKDCNQRVQKWLLEMSKHVKSLDKNHLVTIGSEGFYGDSTPKLLQYNPQAWAADMGQDFVLNTDIPDVDFATVHAWPDNWMLSQVRQE